MQLEPDPFACMGDWPEIQSLASYVETWEDGIDVSSAFALGILNSVSDLHTDLAGDC